LAWSSNGTVLDFVKNYTEYISEYLQEADVYLIFDRYYEYSTREKCSGTWATIGSMN